MIKTQAKIINIINYILSFLPEKERLNFYVTTCMFPGSRTMCIKPLPQGICTTQSHLIKIDQNGTILTEKPGEPFKRDPGSDAGFDLSKQYLHCLKTRDTNKFKYTTKFNHY
jgi:hypothetical protein